MNNPYTRFVGIDLGSEFHQICVVDPTGNIICERKVEHGGAGIQQMLAWLTELPGAVSPETVAVALEAPRGAVVEALLERGYAVFSINPKQVDRFRDRHSVAGAKDDARDAYVQADALRTDLSHFRRLCADHLQIIRLRELSRADDKILRTQRRSERSVI